MPTMWKLLRWKVAGWFPDLPVLAAMTSNDVRELHEHTLGICLVSWAAYVAVAALSTVASPMLFGEVFTSLPSVGKMDWHGRVVGAAFAILVLCLAVPEYLNPGDALVAEPIFGSTPRSHLAVSIAVGYFIWDVAFCLAQYQTIQVSVMVHGLAVLSLYGSILQPPFIQGAACFFLCWEASTPLLNLRAQLIACGKAEGRLYAAVSVLFAASFLGVRLGLGLPGSVRWWGDMLALLAAEPRDPRTNPALVYYALTCNVVLNSLNLLWGYKIVVGLVKLVAGKGRKNKTGDLTKDKRK